jgi:hypothetical protein
METDDGTPAYVMQHEPAIEGVMREVSLSEDGENEGNFTRRTPGPAYSGYQPLAPGREG